MNDPTLPLPGLSSVSGKPVVVKFDGGLLSSDGGVLALREVEQRLRVADRLAACMIDPRAADQITHSLADVIRFRLLMISAGYEDGIDANSLAQRSDVQDGARSDAVGSGTVLAVDDLAVGESARRSRPVADGPGDGRSLLRVLRRRFPNGSRSTSTTRSMRSTAASNCGCSTPTTTNTDFSRSSCSTARAASSPPCFVPPNGRAARRSSPSCAGCCARSALIGLTPRSCCAADSHYCGPEVLDWCRANGLDYILGVAPTTTLRRHVEDLEASTKARFEAAPRDGKLRRFKEFFDGAQSWSRVERIIARVEVGRGRTGHPLRRHQSDATQRSRGSTKTSIAGAARPKTISNPGRPIWRRIARPAPRRPPTSSASSSTPAPIG